MSRTSTHRDINDQDGNVTQRTSSGSQVGKRLVSRGINDQQPRNLVLDSPVLVDDGRLLLDGLDREVGGTNLLGDSTCFTFLNTCLTNLIV